MDADPNSPVVIADMLTEAEAAMLVAHLQTQGVSARISGVGGSTGWPEAAGYAQVFVRQTDLERARNAVHETGLRGDTTNKTTTSRRDLKCPDCAGAMSHVKLIDKAEHPLHADFEYTVPEARRSFWTGRFPIEGKVDAYMCGQCGRILLYGLPSDDK